MIRRQIAALVLVAPLLTGWDAAQAQECRWVKVTSIIQNQVYFVWVKKCSGSEVTGIDGGGTPALPPPAGSALCGVDAEWLGEDADELCGSGDAVGSAPVVTTDLVTRAFRRIPLPASDLGIQPPGGKTLVNFETNFFTADGQPFTRTLRLLGQRVELRIWAESWTWHYGDGESETTTSPGARFPDLEITHNYLAKQTYQPRVDTTYAAEWRVGSGSWQPVSGTATITGEPVGLRAIEARPTLVGYAG